MHINESVYLVWYTFIIPAIVLEKQQARPALGRSRDLVRGQAGRVFGLYWIPAFLNVALIYFAPQFLAGALGISTYDLLSRQLVGQAVAVVWSLVLGPYLSLLLVLLYYHVRARSENYDEHVLAEEMAYAPIEEMMNV